MLYIAEAFAYFISGILMEIKCLGRKRTIWGGFVITISCCLSLAFINLNQTIYFILDLLARFCISANHTIFYTYSLEVYPTPVRTIGFGINAGFGSFASIISPMLLELFNMNTNFIIYAILCVIAMFLMIFLQETVGKPMKESIDELNEEYDDDEQKNNEDIKNNINKNLVNPIENDTQKNNDENISYEPLFEEKKNEDNNSSEEKKDDENEYLNESNQN